ncbi:MAG: hypothetical protein EXS25_00175 [Pedosphaera sp.]|nr:hypothetical protein [Pedosphaera sp.]
MKNENAASCSQVPTAGLLTNGTSDKSVGLRGFHLAVDRPQHAVVSLFLDPKPGNYGCKQAVVLIFGPLMGAISKVVGTT